MEANYQTNDKKRKETDNLESGTKNKSRQKSPERPGQPAQNQDPAWRESGASQDSNSLIPQRGYSPKPEIKTQPEAAGNDAGNSQGEIGKLPVSGEDSVFCKAITEEDAKKITEKLQEYVDLVMDTNKVLIVITLGANNIASNRGNQTIDPKANTELQSKPQLLQDAKEKFTKVLSLQFDPEITEIKEEEGNLIRVKINAAFPLKDKGKSEDQVFNKIKEIIDKLRNKEDSGFILMNTITDKFYPMLSKIIQEAIPKPAEMTKGYQTAYINSYFAKDNKFKVYIPLNPRVSYNKEVTGSLNLSHARDKDG